MSAADRFAVDHDRVRSAKEALISRGLGLSDDLHPTWLPVEIDRSWRRSIGAGANRASGGLQFIDEVDSESELCRAAVPVLDRLAATLQDMGTAIFLADRSGQIVARRVSGRSQRERFDNAYAAEGFDFSEASIGTNGLGTAIEEGSAVFVRGAEHFNEALEQLACAGVGMRHPATGRLIGSLSLAAAVDAAEMMMLAMAREGARQIVDNLTATVGRREVALGRSYQQHRAKGPVIVLNCDTVMTNVTGLSFVNVEMHARLWDALVAQVWDDGPQELDLDLQVLKARVLAHRLEDMDGAAFAVEILDRERHGGPVGPHGPRSAGDPLVDRLARRAVKCSSALAVTGPSGSGKLHVAREWLHREGYDRPLQLESESLTGRGSWRREAATTLADGGAVVLRRLEDIDPRHLNAIKVLADHHHSLSNGAAPRLVFTADLSRCPAPVAGVLAQVAVSVDLPPLAKRQRDIPALVDAVLADIEPGRRPVVTAATMQRLLRWDWPGNVAELRHLLHTLAEELPGRAVSPRHLPEPMWKAANRRPLSRIESAERTEILAALRESDGNRSRAASLLGIGRTTLYRKLRALGVDDDALLS